MTEFLADYHTHTVYCDGKSTPREMAERAYALRFKALGFSGHGYTPFDDSYCMTERGTEKYILEISALKEKYSAKMEIFTGVEADIFANRPAGSFDYVIGSCHYVKCGESYYPIDKSAEDFSALLSEGFGGDFEAMAEQYYREFPPLFERLDADIIGHFDILTKYAERIMLPRGERYYAAAFSAVDKLISANKPFEINVGAISRGYRTAPYPDEKILAYIKDRGGSIILGGDCHSAGHLGKNLDTGAEIARKCGFTHRVVITKDGFGTVEL